MAVASLVLGIISIVIGVLVLVRLAGLEQFLELLESFWEYRARRTRAERAWRRPDLYVPLLAQHYAC